MSNLILLAAVTILSHVLTGYLHAEDRNQQEFDSTPGQAAAVIDKDALERFFDRVIQEQMQQHHIPGATIAVVKDGATLFAKGYGYAKLEEKIRVDPDNSLFRIASITKLFTWTAVMQLAEKGKLDLNCDVNDYISAFQIPNDYPDPITLAHLMAHTAGFEDRGLIGTLAHSPEGVISLEQYLASNMPARVRPPGQVSAYSNYGGALAGYIVTEVSGLPYDQYVQEKIFTPLGMNRATALQAAEDENMVSSYLYRDGIQHPVPFAYLIPVPEGGISTSATSMARFMIAHLEEGKVQGNAVLRPETSRQMLRQSFTHHPKLPGWAHGFEEKNINGHRVLEHGGLLSNFTSSLLLVPSKRLGLFVAFNSRGGSRAGRELKQQFFDEFLPSSTPVSVPAKSDPTASLENYAGFYTPCRSAHTTMAKLGTLVQVSSLKVDNNNSISFLGRKWLQQEPGLWRSAVGEELLAVKENPKGQSEYLFIGTSAWKRLPWYQTPVFQLTLLGSCLLMFLSTLIVWPIAHLRARPVRKNAASITRTSIADRGTAGLLSAINLVFVTALAMILSGDTSALEYGIPFSLRLLLILPIVSAALAFAVVIFSIVSWKTKSWSRFGRIHYALVALASVAFVWFLGFWNLIGWKF